MIGASDGNVYEAFIEPSTEFYRREERFVKNVFHTADGPVIGLWADTAAGRPEVLRVLVATPSKLFHFSSRSTRTRTEGGSLYSKLFDGETPQVRDAPEPSRDIASFSAAPDSLDEGSAASIERPFAWSSGQAILVGGLADP